MADDLRITVYDKSFAKKGTIGAAQSVVMTPRHNQQPTGAITIPYTHPRIDDLKAPGARVLVTYGGAHLMSGVVSRKDGQGPSQQASLTFQIEDDYRLLRRILSWPSPANTLAVGQQATQRLVTGPAETVLKTIVAENATRLGLPLTIATDQGRGATITSSLRFQNATDRVMADFDAAGVGVTVQQVGTGLVLDCYTPRVYPRTLTESSKVVRDWSWYSTNPTATRVLVLGPGEGSGQLIVQRGAGGALETAWGDVIEVVVDATSAETIADMEAIGDAALAGMGPTSGMSVTLAQTNTFRYTADRAGAGVSVGDLITMQVGPGITETDVLREATLSLTADNGLTVTPTVGEKSDVFQDLTTSMGSIARAVRNQLVRR